MSLYPYKRLCVLRLSAIGDTCHALAVVRRIQDNWPECQITWVIGKTEASLMAGIEGVEFIIFDKKGGRAARKQLARQLSERSFDAALCMHASMRANFISLHIDAPVKLGFDKTRARDFQQFFTNERIPAEHGQHALEAMMSFATSCGVGGSPLRWDIPVSGDDRAFARQYADDDRKLVVISPCSSQRSRNFRNWPVANFLETVDYLVNTLSCNVVLTGGKSTIEQEYATAIENSFKGKIDNLVGKTSLKQLFALISQADAVLCPDSGPAHMATAAGTPVVGLYATSNPARTGPYLSQATTVNRYPDAVRQFLQKDPEELRWGARVRHADAMALITFDDVKPLLDQIIS